MPFKHEESKIFKESKKKQAEKPVNIYHFAHQVAATSHKNFAKKTPSLKVFCNHCANCSTEIYLDIMYWFLLQLTATLF